MQTIVNLGTGGADLNGQNGSTTSADSNDALFLDWPGDNGGNYVYLPDGTGNLLTIEHEASLNVAGDFTFDFDLAMDDWANGTQIIAGKRAASGSYEWFVYLTSTGLVNLTVSTTGSNDLGTTSTAAVPFADGERGWVRIERNKTAGEVKFYTSLDGVTFSQLGSTKTGFTTDDVFASTSSVRLGARISSESSKPGKWYGFSITNDDTATVVLDVDTSAISSGSDESFTALTGQTVTINRSTSGRKSVAVVSPVWLFGTDDYMQVADNALLDFDADESFTVLAVVRQWATPANDVWVQKRPNWNNSAEVGWGLRTSSALRPATQLSDGTSNFNSGTDIGYTVGETVVAFGVIDRTADTQRTWTNGAEGAAGSISGLGSLSNSDVLGIGASSTPNGQADVEILATAIFRRALSADEITQLTTYYQARWS